jgi:hypothetical protein
MTDEIIQKVNKIKYLLTRRIKKNMKILFI